ncbi:MAG: hypothetical protein ACRYFZ_20920 [Janthinobacterium lividum]
MGPVLSAAQASVAPSHPEPSFHLSRSQSNPAFYQLSLEDTQGCLAHWVVPLPLKHLAKRPMLLWLLPIAGPTGTLTCLDTGPLQLAPAHPGMRANLRADLGEGLLRLNFSGHLLRGYFRLQCLPEGGGQLWQLTPIGYV